MTALRFSLLALISLLVAGIGAVLWFDPVPTATASDMGAADAVLASSAALGVGVWMPQLAVAAQSVNGSGGGPALVALAAKPTPTPRVTATDEPPDTPTATRTRGPTNTPAATRTPAPTRTPVLAILTDCGDITQPGTYSLGASLSRGGDCLNIRSNNVVLDCKGQSIAGDGANGYGIAVRTVGLIPQRTNNVEIRGCKVSGFRYGIYVEGSSNLFIHDNNVSGNFSDVDDRRYGAFLGMAEGGGIRVNNSVGVRVDNNTTNDEAIGVDVRGSSNVKVRGNQASNNTAWGVNFWQTGGSEISGNTTSNNIRYCTWGAGVVGPGCDAGGIVLQYGSSSNVVSNNQVTGGNGNGIFIKAHAMPCGNNNVIANNTISGALYNSIEIGFCTGTQIIGNQISGALDGIWMGFTTGVTIKNNTIQNHRNHGLIANHSHDNLIANNNFINDNEALYLFWEPVNPGDFGWLNVDQYHTYSNTISGNNISDNRSAGIHLKDAQSNQILNNQFNNNTRNYWFQGNTEGNNISGNNDNTWLPDEFLAFAWK